MEVKIENMRAIRAAYVRRFGSYDESSKQAWEVLCRWAGPRGLLGPQTTFLGISYDNPDITAPDRLRYDACITIPPKIKPEGEIGLLELPACRVAKAHYEGLGEGIKDAYRGLYGRWLPQSGFVPASLPCFEIYLNEPDKEGRFDSYITLAAPAGESWAGRGLFVLKDLLSLDQLHSAVFSSPLGCIVRSHRGILTAPESVET